MKIRVHFPVRKWCRLTKKQQRLVKPSVYLQVRYKAFEEGLKRVSFSEEGDLRQRQTSKKAIEFNLL